MPNHLYEWLAKWWKWAPRDNDSQMKFAIQFAKEFELPLGEAERLIAEYASREKTLTPVPPGV